MTLPASRLVAALVLSCLAACSAELATPIPQSDGNVAGGPKGTTTPPMRAARRRRIPPPGSSSSSNGGGARIEAGAPPVTFEAGPRRPCPTPAREVAAPGRRPARRRRRPRDRCGLVRQPRLRHRRQRVRLPRPPTPTRDTVQMGCQAGGECICLVNQQTSTQPFDEDGACSDPSSTASQFMRELRLPVEGPKPPACSPDRRGRAGNGGGGIKVRRRRGGDAVCARRPSRRAGSQHPSPRGAA